MDVIWKKDTEKDDISLQMIIHIPLYGKVDDLVIIYYSNIFSTLIMYHMYITLIGPCVYILLVFIHTKSVINRVGHLEQYCI